MNFNTQISFKPTPEMAAALAQLFETSCKNKEITKTDFINQVVLKALTENESDVKAYVFELQNNIETLKQKLKKAEIALLEANGDKNENARIAQQLQVENEQLKNQNSNQNELFTPENKYKLWCMLQIFKRMHQNWTIEDMIFFIVKSYQEAGYLNLEKEDLEYIETIKHNYDGTF